MRWETKPLSDVVDILDSCRVPVNSTERAKRIGDIPYYGATGHVGFIDEYLFDEELVLLGEDGAPFLDAGKPKAYLVRGKSWVNNHAHVLRGKAGMLNGFLLFQLNHLDYRPYVSGTTRLKLPQGPMKQIPLLVPPLPEQRRIVAEIEKQFSRLEEGVSALKRVQANLKRYRAAVLKAACEGRLVESAVKSPKPKGKSVETGELLLKRILEERRKKWQGRGSFVEPSVPNTSLLPQLPNGWTWATIEQLSNVVRGASPRPAGDPRYFGGNVPWITVGPLTADNSPYLKSVKTSLNELGREHSRYIEPQTLLFTNSGATLGVPKISLIGGCINDGVAALLDVEYPLKLYLLYFLRTQTEQLRGVNQGAAQPNLNTAIIKAINVPLPPLAEQKRIVEEVERRLSVIEELEFLVTTNLQRATRLRQSILQKAFEGELV